jgi:hypothetical protein
MNTIDTDLFLEAKGVRVRVLIACAFRFSARKYVRSVTASGS